MKLFLGMLMCIGVTAVQAASFPCERAATSTEKTICQYRALNDADVKMATVYNIVLGALPMGGRDAEKTAQAQWIKQRNVCNVDVRCIANIYQNRQQHLDSIVKNRILTQGPF